MNIEEFWKIIDTSVVKNNLDIKEQINDIQIELSSYSIEDIKEFNYISEQMIEKAKSNNLLESISKLFEGKIMFDGGISWSTYEFFIGWLMMQGSEIFHFAMKDSDSVNDLIQNIYNGDINKCLCEEAIFIASSAYELKTGRDYFEDFSNL